MKNLLVITLLCLVAFRCQKVEPEVQEKQATMAFDQYPKYVILGDYVLKDQETHLDTVGVLDQDGASSTRFDELKDDIAAFTSATNTYKYWKAYCPDNPCYEQGILRNFFAYAEYAGKINKEHYDADLYLELIEDIESI